MHAKSIKYEYPSLKNSYFMLLDRGKLAVNNPLLIYNFQYLHVYHRFIFS